MDKADHDAHREEIVVRVVTFLVVVPTIVVLAVHPALRTPFDVIVAAALVVGAIEYYRLVSVKSFSVRRWTLVVGVLIIAAAAHMGAGSAGFALVVLALCLCHLYRRPPTISGMAAETFGLLYVGLLGSHVIQLRALPAGSGHIILLFASVWLTDTGAYLVGSGFGRWKLSPRLSPRKTVEGAVAGLLFAAMGAALLKQMQVAGKGPPMPPYTMWQYVGVAVLASVVGQAGDLVESALKRDAKIKDSGALFPGHGGLLDRCDSLLFAAPVVYYYAKLVLK